MRAHCDGCDPARPCDEHADHASLWIVTAGAFVLRDHAGAHVLDPTHALVVPAGHEFRIRHPGGPDTVVSFRGPLVDEIAATGARSLPLHAGDLARIASALGDRSSEAIAGEPWRTGRAQLGSHATDDRELALSEALVHLVARQCPARPAREVVDAIEHVLRLDVASGASLRELSQRAGYSLFHACRVFRATTGQTLHQFRRELRLRHALARIVGGDESLVEVAARTGFASQSHLTNLFRARFGITPARARTHEGLRALAISR